MDAKNAKSSDLNALSYAVIGAALRIHSRLGPGLLESVYHRVMLRSLTRSGLYVESEKVVGFEFEGDWFDGGLIIDLVVERSLIVELKSREKLRPVDHKQLLTYLKLTGCKLGLLINFGEFYLKDGIKRIANGI